MSFASIKSQQFANTFTISVSGNNARTTDILFFSENLPLGKYIFQLDLDITTSNILTECIIHAGTNFTSATPSYVNVLKFDQPEKKYYCNMTGCFESVGTDFQMDLYVITDTLYSDFAWKGTVTFCKVV
jgi:hypothetical protein